MNDAGLITIVALVSPFEAARADARSIVGGDRFVEVYLSAPADVCETRDDEGLYERAKSGEIERFTGVSGPYEPPASPDLELPTGEIAIDEAVGRILRMLQERSLLGE